MQGGDGLRPSSEGKRVVFEGDRRTVVDGPFPAVGELVPGFWLWEVEDMDEALEWVRRSPNPMPGPSQVEIRTLYEVADFAEAMTTEQAEEEEEAASGVGEPVGPDGRCLRIPLWGPTSRSPVAPACSKTSQRSLPRRSVTTATISSRSEAGIIHCLASVSGATRVLPWSSPGGPSSDERTRDQPKPLE